jgi:hypothetical protein
MFADPLGEPHHDQAFATALRVPNDPAFTLPDALLSGFYRKILIVAGYLLIDKSKQNG